jgi:hypothetical protein
MSTVVLVGMVVAAVIAFTALQMLAQSRQRRSASRGAGLGYGAAKPLGRRGVVGRRLAAIRASRRRRAAAGQASSLTAPSVADRHLPGSTQRL